MVIFNELGAYYIVRTRKKTIEILYSMHFLTNWNTLSVYTRLTSFSKIWFTDIGGIYEPTIEPQENTARVKANLVYQLNKIARMYYEEQSHQQILEERISNISHYTFCVSEAESSQILKIAETWEAIISGNIELFDNLIQSYDRVSPNHTLSSDISPNEALSSDFRLIYVYKAYALFQQSSYYYSLDVYNEALSILSTTANPDHQLELWLMFGKLEVLNELNDLNQSMNLCNVISEKLDNFPDMAYMKPGLLFNKAGIFSKQRLYADELKIYDKLITMATQYTDTKTDVSNYTARQIYTLLLKQRNNFFNHKTKNLIKVMQMKVTVLLRQNRTHEAVQALDEIIKLQDSESQIEFLKDKANILNDVGRYDQSLIVWGQVSSQTQRPQVRLVGDLMKAITRVKLGQYPQAIAEFKRIETKSQLPVNKDILHSAQYNRKHTQRCYHHQMLGAQETPCDFWKKTARLGDALVFKSSNVSHIEVELADIDGDVINIADIQLQYRQLDKAQTIPDEEWRSGPKVAWSSRPKVLTFAQLSPDTTYQMRALLIQKNEKFYDGGDIPILIKTTLSKPEPTGSTDPPPNDNNIYLVAAVSCLGVFCALLSIIILYPVIKHLWSKENQNCIADKHSESMLEAPAATTTTTDECHSLSQPHIVVDKSQTGGVNTADQQQIQIQVVKESNGTNKQTVLFKNKMEEN